MLQPESVLDRCPTVLGLVNGDILEELYQHVSLIVNSPFDFLGLLLTSTAAAVAQSPPLIKYLLFFLLLRAVNRTVQTITGAYQGYLDLGRGGTPSTFRGWLRTRWLSALGGINVLEPPHIPPFQEPYRGLLWRLPQRRGCRPIVAGIAPQRQIDQKTSPETFECLLDLLTTFHAAGSNTLLLERSTLEKHAMALKASLPGPIEFEARGQAGEFGHEICHPHQSDGSLHMILHPEDIRTAIEAGWAERQPLARSSWYWRFYHHVLCRSRVPVPEYLVFVYAPRDSTELAVVAKLMQAAVWFKTGKIIGERYIRELARLKQTKCRSRKQTEQRK